MYEFWGNYDSIKYVLMLNAVLAISIPGSGMLLEFVFNQNAIKIKDLIYQLIPDEFLKSFSESKYISSKIK